KVTDFGLARAEPDRAASSSGSALLGSPLTVAGSLMGTPAYMAPEQLRGKTADARTDQFSFCVSLYRALYRVDPFAGAGDERLAEIAANRVHAPASGVPARVERAIIRGLRADPAERWPDMLALISALERQSAVVRERTAIGAALLAGLIAASAAT